MIYKNVGMKGGELIYEGHPDFNRYFPFVVMPQLILSFFMFRNIHSVPKSLIDAQMFNSEELQPGPISKNMVLPIIIVIVLLSIGVGYFFAKRLAGN